MASKLFKDITLIDETITQDQLDRFAISALRDYCKQNSLASGGTKDVIIKRILEHVDMPESKENGDPNLSESLEKMHVSKKKETTTRRRKATEDTEEKEKETTSKKRGKGVQFHTQSERVHVFDRADPPAANIYDVFGNNKGAQSSLFDEETRNIIRRKQDDKHVKIATEGVASTVFSLHDVIGDAEIGRDTEELTLKELKEELKWRGASTIGTRRELIDRLDEIISGRPKQKKVKKDVPSWLTWK